jgi:hypothetical protein
VVEGEGIEVNLIDVGDPDADVVLRCCFELCWRTDNLPVEKSAINSRLATKDDEQRLGLSGREFACFV